ncbi:MAG: ABC transporter ATP-binding protein [Alphaproteobacteria bacterium]
MPRQFKSQYLNLAALFWHYLYERRWEMVVFYILSAIGIFFVSMQPYTVGQVFNTLQRNDANLIHDIIFWVGLYAFLNVAFWAFHGPSRCMERSLAFIARKNFYSDYYKKLSQLPISWHANRHSGNTINRINKAATSLGDFGGGQFMYIHSVIRGAVSLIILGFINIYIALILVLFSVVIFSSLILFDRILVRVDHEANEREHEFSAKLFDYVSNFSSVISYNLTAFTQSRLALSFAGIWPPHRTSIIVNEVKWCAATLLIALAEFIVLIGYIYYFQAANKVIMIGTIVAVYQYMQQLNGIFYSFAGMYQQLIQQNTNIKAIYPIEEDYKNLAVQDENFPDLQVTKAAIDFKNIDFYYNDQNTVFKNLNLTIPGGQKVGLVGHSGAGKTSLVSLLLRFYNPVSGNILIDGQDLQHVTQASQRDAMAVIPQDISLFEDTLMENIRFGRLDATDEEVKKAAEQANAHEFINALPETYNTYVGERGVRLSGGQRQRIAIARAILRGAPLLVLDEATSSLDSHSENLIQQALLKLMHGKTVIAIAHRLSTIAHLDRLVVMDEGRIVEDGTHAELLQKNGLYAQLWSMQSGGFIGI